MCIITSLVMAVAFVAAVIIKEKKLPDSISAMVYLLPRQWLWSAWLLVVGLTVAIPLIEVMPDEWKFLAFLMLICLASVSTMPLVKRDMQRWHNTFGIGAGVLSQVCVLIVSPMWLILWPVALGCIITAEFVHADWAASVRDCIDGKFVFLAEAICSMAVYGALF